MENSDIISLWKSYDKKLEDNLLFNKKNAEDITKLKVQSLIGSMKPLKIFTILIGIIWVGIVDILIINLFHEANPIFLISAGIQVLLTKLAIGIYLYQMVLIHQIDISSPILKTQEKLTRLKSTTLWIARLLFLQLPFWTTFYWNESMLVNGNVWLYTLQFLVTSVFSFIAIWLFFNIRYVNRNKRWFQIIFSGNFTLKLKNLRWKKARSNISVCNTPLPPFRGQSEFRISGGSGIDGQLEMHGRASLQIQNSNKMPILKPIS